MIRTLALTLCALIAFAANSILCRLALRPNSIDAASFTAVRIFAGALVLLMLALARSSPAETRADPAPQDLARTVRGARPRSSRGPWPGSITSGAALAIYALPFSLAYVRLDASTGALILFAAVQLTIFGWSVLKKQRPQLGEWLGLGLAAAGVIWLNAPSASAPDPIGAALMAFAGIAWGAYTIRGRAVSDPLAATAKNFAFALPMVLIAALVSIAADHAHANARGLMFAAASGAIASGLGYVVWYAALRGLSTAQAGVAQLAVPIVAAIGGVLLLDEIVSPRLALAGSLIIAGIALALVSKRTR